VEHVASVAALYLPRGRIRHIAVGPASTRMRGPGGTPSGTACPAGGNVYQVLVGDLPGRYGHVPPETVNVVQDPPPGRDEAGQHHLTGAFCRYFTVRPCTVAPGDVPQGICKSTVRSSGGSW
jgi:hypothetical protein